MRCATPADPREGVCRLLKGLMRTQELLSMILRKRKPLTNAEKRQYKSHGRFDNLHTVAASIVMALLNEKPRIDIETTDSDEIIRQLRTAYKCNRLDYTGRYSAAVKVLCRKYGVRVYDPPSLKDVREYCAEQMDTLWNEVKRFSNPHTYYVDLSQKLWELKRDMIEGHGKI